MTQSEARRLEQRQQKPRFVSKSYLPTIMIDIPIPIVRLRPNDEPQAAATIQPTMQPISYIETTVDIVSASVAFGGQLKLNRRRLRIL